MDETYTLELVDEYDDVITWDKFNLPQGLVVMGHPWQWFEHDDIYAAKTLRLKGPGHVWVIANPNHHPGHERARTCEDDWGREYAMQLGMGLGVDAYNDAMGYGP